MGIVSTHFRPFFHNKQVLISISVILIRINRCDTLFKRSLFIYTYKGEENVGNRRVSSHKQSTQKKQYALRYSQRRILMYLYRFRFMTVDQLVDFRNVSKQTMHRSLETLIDRGFIGKRHDSSFNLAGKPARYYLAKAGIRYMREHYGLSERMLKSYYKNPLVGDAFIDHTVTVLEVYQQLHRLHPGVFEIFTKAEVAPYEFFPEKLPDLYLQRIEETDDIETAYILEVFEAAPFFAIKKRIQEHIEHFDAGEWPDEAYPTVLAVCPDAKVEEKVVKLLESSLDDLDFLVTTKKALLAEDREKAIWSDSVEPEKLTGL